MSATPEQIADWLMIVAVGDAANEYTNRAEHMRAAAATLRAQSEREKVLALALRRLTYWAQTSGGTAGRDDGLVAAIDIAVEALRAHDAALAGAR